MSCFFSANGNYSCSNVNEYFTTPASTTRATTTPAPAVGLKLCPDGTIETHTNSDRCCPIGTEYKKYSNMCVHSSSCTSDTVFRENATGKDMCTGLSFSAINFNFTPQPTGTADNKSKCQQNSDYVWEGNKCYKKCQTGDYAYDRKCYKCPGDYFLNNNNCVKNSYYTKTTKPKNKEFY